MSAPTVPEQPVDFLTGEELVRLIAACQGSTFDDRRDLALIRLFIDTGASAGEVLGLSVDDVDLANQYAIVFGARTTDALRRYLRARHQHKQAGEVLGGPVDPNSEPTGNTIFVLSEVYETPAGVPEHWRLAIEGWQDLPAFMDWSSRVKVGTLHSGSVVQGLW